MQVLLFGGTCSKVKTCKFPGKSRGRAFCHIALRMIQAAARKLANMNICTKFLTRLAALTKRKSDQQILQVTAYRAVEKTRVQGLNNAGETAEAKVHDTLCTVHTQHTNSVEGPAINEIGGLVQDPLHGMEAHYDNNLAKCLANGIGESTQLTQVVNAAQNPFCGTNAHHDFKTMEPATKGIGGLASFHVPDALAVPLPRWVSSRSPIRHCSTARSPQYTQAKMSKNGIEQLVSFKKWTPSPKLKGDSGPGPSWRKLTQKTQVLQKLDVARGCPCSPEKCSPSLTSSRTARAAIIACQHSGGQKNTFLAECFGEATPQRVGVGVGSLPACSQVCAVANATSNAEKMLTVIGHTLKPRELGYRVAVIGDGWGQGVGVYKAVVIEADKYTYTVIALNGNSPWSEAHVLKKYCTLLHEEAPSRPRQPKRNSARSSSAASASTFHKQIRFQTGFNKAGLAVATSKKRPICSRPQQFPRRLTKRLCKASR